MYSIGLMSGTSMDGIEAALLFTDGTPQNIKPIIHLSCDYERIFTLLLKATEFCIKQCDGQLQNLNINFESQLRNYFSKNLHVSSTELENIFKEVYQHLDCQSPVKLSDVVRHSTKLHAMAVKQILNKANLSAEQIAVIGFHGQAMYHHPDKHKSIILGEAQTLTNQLKIPVVYEFREKDMQLGGQGAPLAPIYHQALAIRDKQLPLVVVNCGGISNVTIIPSEKTSQLIAFDTGPGNGLIDQFIRKQTNGKEMMDRNGQHGQHGKVHLEVLSALYEKAIMKSNINYFELPPPKSLDFNDLTLIPELDNLSLEDGCRTLEAFTADSIVRSVLALNTDIPYHWILSGGGWSNPVILEEIKQRLKSQISPSILVQTADQIGWSNAGMEAELFAYLAVRSVNQLPLSFPGTTGVKQPTTGGQYYEPQSL